MTATAIHPTTPDPVARELLQSVVDTARAIFGAAASSIFLFDRDRDELVFQAVSGQGEEFLVGTRFPAGRGIAGWVVHTGEPMVVDDLSRNDSFARDLAESTRYVPDALMAAPLLHASGVLGVLEVLDPSPQARSDLGELDLLAMFARQAATALRAVLDRRVPGGLDTPPGIELAAARALSQLALLDGPGRTAGLRVVDALRELLLIR
jgi:GAF domain-containing protein